MDIYKDRQYKYYTRWSIYAFTVHWLHNGALRCSRQLYRCVYKACKHVCMCSIVTLSVSKFIYVRARLRSKNCSGTRSYGICFNVFGFCRLLERLYSKLSVILKLSLYSHSNVVLYMRWNYGRNAFTELSHFPNLLQQSLSKLDCNTF